MTVRIDRPLEALRLAVLGERRQLIAGELTRLGVVSESLEDPAAIAAHHDLVFASGLYRILPQEALERSRYGVVMFHETPLPEGRGFAPLQWTIENARPNLTVTAFLADAGTDSGPIVCQHHEAVAPADGLGELEEKRARGIRACLGVIVAELRLGVLVSRPQSGAASLSPRRTPADSRLDITRPLIDLWQQIRIADNDRFPAFFIHEGRRVTLRYRIEDIGEGETDEADEPDGAD